RAIAVDAARDFGKNHGSCPQGFEQVLVWPHRLDLFVDRALEEPRAVPARHEIEAVLLEDRPEGRGVARKLAPELDAVVARELRLRQAGLERVLLAELGQVVVRPGERIDADADHQAPTPCRRRAAS